jgi:Bacterial flagellin N-terminal helical region./Bacterial flagellin C-terminal helical region.
MRINHNISALNTLNKLAANTSATTSSLEKLSSGLRINKAADDAAGLAISEKMKSQISGLDTASDNAQNGISLIQTAEGSLSESQAILQRMRELAVQAKNGTNSDTDAAKLQDEADALARDLDRISNNTNFNTKTILSGTTNGISLFSASGITLQIGADDGQTMSISLSGAASGISNVTAVGLGVGSGSGEAAKAIALTGADSLEKIQKAIDAISSMRSKLGAYQNRLTHTINNLNTESENLTSASALITDVDMAEEMTTYTKNNILIQSAEAMLAQANQLPQGVLSLLK